MMRFRQPLFAALIPLVAVCLAPPVAAQEDPPPAPPPPAEQPAFFENKTTGWVDIEPVTLDKPSPQGKMHTVSWNVTAVPQPEFGGKQQSILSIAIPKSAGLKNIRVTSNNPTKKLEDIHHELESFKEAVTPKFSGEEEALSVEKMRRLVANNPAFLDTANINWATWEFLGMKPELWVDRGTDIREGLIKGEDGKALRSNGGYVYVLNQWKTGDKHFFLYKTIPEDIVDAITVETPKNEEQINDPDFENKEATVPLSENLPNNRTAIPALLQYATKATYGGSSPTGEIIAHDIEQSKNLGSSSYAENAAAFTTEISNALDIDAKNLSKFIDYSASFSRGVTVFKDEHPVESDVTAMKKNAGVETPFGDPLMEIIAGEGEPIAHIDSSDDDYMKIFYDTARGETHLTITADVEKQKDISTFPIQAFFSHIVEKLPEQPIRIIDASLYPFGRGYEKQETVTRGVLEPQKRPGDIYGNKQCFVTSRDERASGVDIPQLSAGEKNAINPNETFIAGGMPVFASSLKLATVPSIDDGCDQISVPIPALEAAAAPVEDDNKSSVPPLLMIGAGVVFVGLSLLPLIRTLRATTSTTTRKKKSYGKANESYRMF